MKEKQIKSLDLDQFQSISGAELLEVEGGTRNKQPIVVVMDILKDIFLGEPL